MKRPLFMLIATLILGAIVLSSCGGQQATSDEGTAKIDVPAAFKGKTNTFANNADAAAKGKEIYSINCASCHGDTGKGDGPAGASLDPHPGNLVDAKAKGEDYLFWRVSDGGTAAPFNSSMPAWKGVLTEDEIWQVITYIQTLK